MQIPIYQIDAFSNEIFKGNPAAVCPLNSWLDDTTLKRIAQENNLSETAYFTKEDETTFNLRWFTPEYEIDLCGHATLATAHVILNELNYKGDTVNFKTLSGLISVKKEDDFLILNLHLDFCENYQRYYHSNLTKLKWLERPLQKKLSG